MTKQELQDIRLLIEYAKINLDQIWFAHGCAELQPMLGALRRMQDKFTE